MEHRMTLQMRNALAVIHTATADDAMYLIAFFYQEFTQITTILTGYTGYQGNLSIFHEYC